MWHDRHIERHIEGQTFWHYDDQCPPGSGRKKSVSVWLKPKLNKKKSLFCWSVESESTVSFTMLALRNLCRVNLDHRLEAQVSPLFTTIWEYLEFIIRFTTSCQNRAYISEKIFQENFLENPHKGGLQYYGRLESNRNKSNLMNYFIIGKYISLFYFMF